MMEYLQTREGVDAEGEDSNVYLNCFLNSSTNNRLHTLNFMSRIANKPTPVKDLVSAQKHQQELGIAAFNLCWFFLFFWGFFFSSYRQIVARDKKTS